MIITHESSSQHWYTKTGEPAYTRLTQDGRVRNTTLRDAKKEGLLPSVTTIISMLAKPALERWKQEQVLLASLTLPRQENEPEADWLKRVTEDSRATGKDAMKRGTDMHNLLEAYFDQVYLPIYPQYIYRTEEALRNHFDDQFWITEKSFAHQGYAGKCDLHAEGIVVDFKTKESLENTSVYDEHILQLSAYAYGLNMPNARCAICFVSENETKIVEIDQDKIQKGYEMFTLLVKLFYLKNNLGQG